MTELTVHTCPRCELRFAHLYELRMHLDADHPDVEVDDEPEVELAEPDPALPERWLTVAVDPAHAHPGLIAHAAALAGALGLGVELLAVADPRLAAEGHAFLHAESAVARTHGVDAVRTRLVEGTEVAAEIDRHLAWSPSDLVVVAPRSRHDPGHVFGSTAAHLCATAPVPVVLVGRHVDPAPAAFERVLACVDGTDAAERTIAVADRLRHRLGTELHLVEALDAAVAMPPDVLETSQLVRHAAKLPVPPTTYDVLHGADAARTIERYVREGPRTLVVLGTHGRRGFDRLLHGSIAGRVVDHIGMPAVVVPPTIQLERALAPDLQDAR
jgi:nucleotide-binding universal stress UspA family protein